ncbi:conserved hypothetical protein [Coccidioides posadasii str. Silveira]|uniref:Uncharacterized protein n=2 Tax=Coccidioides posadasii TaxID=199306 RepID=E9DBW7_COCPS|nr:conserved hypothetical protein [Coccidioides posadasii str. Silveira]KMM67786.1 hypothetical protein CPAG_04119 [Coccidioides posadasii RMSCC 3488]
MQSDKWQGKLCQVLSIPGGEIFRRPLDFKRGGGKIIIVNSLDLSAAERRSFESSHFSGRRSKHGGVCILGRVGAQPTASLHWPLDCHDSQAGGELQCAVGLRSQELETCPSAMALIM